MSEINDKILDITLEVVRERLIKSCTDFNTSSKNFVFEYEVKNNFIFCLLTCDIDSKLMPKMQRLLTVNIYEPQKDIYFYGNVVSGYTLEDVKQRTINSLMYSLNQIKKALNYEVV